MPASIFVLESLPLSQMQATNPNPNNDLILGQPTDTVSALAWSPVPQGGGNTELIHLLAASTWDGNLLFYRVSVGGQFEAAQTAAHKAPILDVAWALVRRNSLLSHSLSLLERSEVPITPFLLYLSSNWWL